MRIWKNTPILDNFLDPKDLTKHKKKAEVIILGSKPINLSEFPELKGIFRVGVGLDNVPINEAKRKNIRVQSTSPKTNKYIFEETADFTCHLILKMMYKNLGTVEPWTVKIRKKPLQDKSLLVVGLGNIGRKVVSKMQQFMSVKTFDILENDLSILYNVLPTVDCVTLHFPLTNENTNFFNKDKLSQMKNGSILINTSRAALVSEDALYEEIEKGRLEAAFDVFWEKPYKGKLSQFHPDKFYMTPHVASKSEAYVENSAKDFKSFASKLEEK